MLKASKPNFSSIKRFWAIKTFLVPVKKTLDGIKGTTPEDEEKRKYYTTYLGQLQQQRDALNLTDEQKKFIDEMVENLKLGNFFLDKKQIIDYYKYYTPIFKIFQDNFAIISTFCKKV